MLGLRMEEGISLEDYRVRFHASFQDNYQQELPPLLKEGLLMIKDGHLSVSDKGFYILDHILLRLTQHLEY